MIANFDPWFVGVIGVLTALVPGAMILMAAATLMANIYRAVRRGAPEAAISRVAKLIVPLVALVAVLLTLGAATPSWPG